MKQAKLVNPLTEKLRPHVIDIRLDADQGCEHAAQVIRLYGMHCAAPGDPGAIGLCEAAFDAWKRKRELSP